MRKTLVVALVASLFGACSPTPAATPETALPTQARSPAAEASSGPPSAEPSPSAIPLLSDDELADVSLEDVDITAVCDQDPSDAYMDGEKSTVDCFDGLQLGYRALRTTLAAVDRLYLHRQTCAAIPCTSEELAEVTVIGWSGTFPYSVFINWTAHSITVPQAGATTSWPAATSSARPAVERITIDGAPKEIQSREPFPYCGLATPVGLTTDKPGDFERHVQINRCFMDGVLDRRPVEMVLITDVTEEPVVLRFGGHGFVTRYMLEGEGATRAWYRHHAAALILGISVLSNLDGLFDRTELE